MYCRFQGMGNVIRNSAVYWWHFIWLLTWTLEWPLKSHSLHLYFPATFSWEFSKCFCISYLMKNRLPHDGQQNLGWFECWSKWLEIASCLNPRVLQGQKKHFCKLLSCRFWCLFRSVLESKVFPQSPRSHKNSILPPKLFLLWELTCCFKLIILRRKKTFISKIILFVFQSHMIINMRTRVGRKYAQFTIIFSVGFFMQGFKMFIFFSPPEEPFTTRGAFKSRVVQMLIQMDLDIDDISRWCAPRAEIANFQIIFMQIYVST